MKKKLCLLLVLMFVMSVLSGCSLFGAKKEPEIPKTKLPEIQQGTVDHFPETTTQQKQLQEKTATEQKPVKQDNTTKTKKFELPEIQQGTVDHFPETSPK